MIHIEKPAGIHAAGNPPKLIGLVLVGLLGLHHPSRWFDGAGWAMLIGVIFFSGLLFAWLATGQRFFVYPVPVGGVAFIIGWWLTVIGASGFWTRN